ncbi:MAG: STAS domain-containing protein [Idiomarina sp.]|nr:STAS domain-containing protein [Idiomarina sp.]
MAQQLQFNAKDGEVVVTGDLDRNTVPQGWADRKRWLPTSKDVVLNLEGVDHVDSAGLAMLIRLRSELEADNQNLVLHNLNTQLQQFARVSGVEGLVSLS